MKNEADLYSATLLHVSGGDSVKSKSSVQEHTVSDVHMFDKEKSLKPECNVLSRYSTSTYPG